MSLAPPDRKLESPGYYLAFHGAVMTCLAILIERLFVTDRRTDRQTDGHKASIYRGSIALRGRKRGQYVIARYALPVNTARIYGPYLRPVYTGVKNGHF